MNMGGLAKPLISALMILYLAVPALPASPYDELKIKREQVFEFTRKPEVTRNGDIVTITFESRGFCDCTVAIENDKGRIVRHLASGVLGSNAPLPFRRNSKKQTILWDGKDDLGRYVDDKDRLTIRVSLGLKPRFERTLFWEPKRRTQGDSSSSNWSVLPVAVPEGVYVYQGASAEYVHFFDHDGNYIRTVYPFPREKLEDVKGLKWVAFPPDGERFPVKWGIPQNTLLTTHLSSAGQDTKWLGGGSMEARAWSQAAGMAVQKNRIALAGYQLNRLATDGSTPRLGSGQAGGLTLDGVIIGFKTPKETWRASAKWVEEPLVKELNVGPRSIAFSPDGQWVYMTGYLAGAWNRYWLHGVARTRFGGAGKAECWIGEMKKHGTDNAHFCAPTSVAVDAKGRVYVADYANDRIQVFSGEGRYLKTIPVKKPTQIFLHPKTGDLYVCSWLMAVRRLIADKEGALNKTVHVPAALTHLGPLEAPKRKKTYVLPLTAYRSKYHIHPRNMGLDYRVEMDFYTDPLRVWIVQFSERSKGRGDAFEENIEIYELRQGKLQLRRSFSEDVKKTVIRETPPVHARQRLYFDHKNEWLYVGEGTRSGKAYSYKWIGELVRVDPNSGAISFVKLPFFAEDLGFDMQGMAHLRMYSKLVRYDASASGGWREVPYDYGEELKSTWGFGAKNVISCISFPGYCKSSCQLGGMGVGPDGTVAMHAWWHPHAEHRKDPKAVFSNHTYVPRLFPGRRAEFQIRMFDKHGKCVTMDALPGAGWCQGIQVDKDHNIYVQTDYVRMYGKKRCWNQLACTLVKAKPEKAAVLATGGAPVKLERAQYPKRPRDVHIGWIQGAEWLYGGLAVAGRRRFDVTPTINCHCTANARFALDYFARSFVSESDRYRIAVLDTNGNLITRIGRYGNVDDGMPLIKAGGPPNPRSIGGDEVAIMHCFQMTTHTDKRLFLADWGNYRILSVRLGYHAEERIALRDVADKGE